jgi:hypothetical protein
MAQAFQRIYDYIGVTDLMPVHIAAKLSFREETGMTMFANTPEKGPFLVSIVLNLSEHEPCGLNILGELKQWWYLNFFSLFL